MFRNIITLMLLTGIAVAEEGPSAASAKTCPHCAVAAGKYTRRSETYSLPQVMLIDHHGESHELKEVLGQTDKPILLTFSFTTCSTICPVLNATFASVQKQLGKENQPVRLLTISIDPMHDTPARLAEFAESFQAADNWTFFTGTDDDIQTLRKAFNAHTVSKSRHAPLIFIRPTRGDRWRRLDGLMSSQQLLAEFRAAVAEKLP